MSEKSSEYLKRTCLICGCHTDQTINIYEPRSGPNIVELIQAKFKIQPLNEEKYLCFSCNNWLINWHSLQALNSNDADSPSGTFRPHMNGMLYKEKSENQRQQTQFKFCIQTILQHHRRPTAKVHPWRITTETPTPIPSSAKHSNSEVLKKHLSFSGHRKIIPKFQRKNHSRTYGKHRVILRNIRLRRLLIKYLSNGCSCSSSIKLRNPKSISSDCTNRAYGKCVEAKKERNLYEHEKKPKQKGKVSQRSFSEIPTLTNGSINIVNCKFEDNANTTDTNNQCLQRPLVDGKVVSMLRRLGTTLSHENFNEKPKTENSLLPRIMSPTKSKPRWMRHLDEDEILINFNNAISEVLPQDIRNQKQNIQDNEKFGPEALAALQAKQKLAYQVSIDKDNSQYVYPLLPEGLSISLI